MLALQARDVLFGRFITIFMFLSKLSFSSAVPLFVLMALARSPFFCEHTGNYSIRNVRDVFAIEGGRRQIQSRAGERRGEDTKMCTKRGVV